MEKIGFPVSDFASPILPKTSVKEPIAKRSKTVIRQIGRKALFITRYYNDSALQMLTKEFPECRPLQMDFDSGIWRIWFEN